MFNNRSKSDRFVETDKKGRFWIASIFFVSVALLLDVPDTAKAEGNTYYVSKTGNDSNAGTISAPWRTLSKASRTLVAGDTAYVRGGTYTESTIMFSNDGTASRPIQLLAYPGEVPIVDGGGHGSGTWAIFGVQKAYITLSGFELRNGPTGIDWEGVHGTVRNMNVHHNWGPGIYFRGGYGLVENNTVSWNCLTNAANPGVSDWPIGLAAFSKNHIIVRGNTVFNNYGEGIDAYETDGTLVENNVVYDNWATNTYFGDARNCIFRNNLVYSTPNPAISTRFATPLLFTLADERADRTRSSNNIVINNMFLRGNLHAFEWTGVAGSGLVNNLIANNTLVNGAIVTGSTIAVNKATTIQNNIVYRNDGGTVASVPSNAGLTFKNNLWSTAPPSTAMGSGDIIGNPMLSLSGGVGSGQLIKGYFALASTSPVIGKGAAIDASTDYYWITSQGVIPNIGAYPSNNSPVKYLSR